jgi:adenine-specific DNA glycosylase
MSEVEHGFTHFTLTISPQRVQVVRIVPVMSERDRQWFVTDEAKTLGIPAPVRRILERLEV